MADVRLAAGRLDRINVQNDPVNMIDPFGLEGWGFMQAYQHFHNEGRARSQPGYTPPSPEAIAARHEMMSKQYSQMARDIKSGVNSAMIKAKEGLSPRPLNERVEQLNNRINWQTDHSGLKENLNAPPWHPMMWEKDVIWWAFVWYWNEDYQFLEPWGHPFFPDDECHH